MVAALKANWNVHDVLLFNRAGLSQHWHNEQLDIPWIDVPGKDGRPKRSTLRPVAPSARPNDAPRFTQVRFARKEHSLSLLTRPPMIGGGRMRVY